MTNNSISPILSQQTDSLISVIMPCFNAENYLRESVKCVFDQTHKNVELIVIDDGSTDSSQDILKELVNQYNGLKVLTQSNKGPYPARNLGLESCEGTFVAFLDADDYWASDCLEKLYRRLRETDSDLSYCGWQNIVENGKNGTPYLPPDYGSMDLYREFLKNCPWPIHAALTRRSIIMEVKGFATRSFSAMDYDFWLRISATTLMISRVPEVLAFYRWHDHGQISSVKWRQILDSWKVRKFFIDNSPELVAHIPEQALIELVDGYVKRQAYSAVWKRDLISAQYLFRAMWRMRHWKADDLKYMLPSLLPKPLFKGLVTIFDQ